jgi:hypothetical protein
MDLVPDLLNAMKEGAGGLLSSIDTARDLTEKL